MSGATTFFIDPAGLLGGDEGASFSSAIFVEQVL
jgi:hypothetical protein